MTKRSSSRRKRNKLLRPGKARADLYSRARPSPFAFDPTFRGVLTGTAFVLLAMCLLVTALNMDKEGPRRPRGVTEYVLLRNDSPGTVRVYRCLQKCIPPDTRFYWSIDPKSHAYIPLHRDTGWLSILQDGEVVGCLAIPRDNAIDDRNVSEMKSCPLSVPVVQS